MWDNETMFSMREALSDGLVSRVVDAGPDDLGRGEAVYLQVALTGGAAGDLTVAVDTAGDEEMTSARRLAVYAVPAARVARSGVILAAAIPTGCARYLRLTYSGAAGGKVTSGLTLAAHTSGMS